MVYKPVARPMMRTTSGALTARQKAEIAKYVKRIQTNTFSKKLRFWAPSKISTKIGEGLLFNPLSDIGAGTQPDQRVGNTIHLQQIDVNLLFTNTTDDICIMRIFAFWASDEFVTGSNWTAWPNSSIPNLVFDGSNVQGYNSLLMFKEWKAQPVYESGPIVSGRQVNAGNGGLESQKQVSFSMKFNKKKITYQQDNAPAFVEGKNLYIFIVCDTGSSVPIGTVSGHLFTTMKVKYYE